LFGFVNPCKEELDRVPPEQNILLAKNWKSKDACFFQIKQPSYYRYFREVCTCGGEGGGRYVLRAFCNVCNTGHFLHKPISVHNLVLFLALPNFSEKMFFLPGAHSLPSPYLWVVAIFRWLNVTLLINLGQMCKPATFY